MDLAPGYREFAPPPPLAPLIACLWVRACGSDDEVAITPDGASDVIWRQGHVPPAVVFRRFLAAAADRRPDPLVLAAAPRVAQGNVAALARELAGLSPVGVIAARRAA